MTILKTYISKSPLLDWPTLFFVSKLQKFVRKKTLMGTLKKKFLITIGNAK